MNTLKKRILSSVVAVAAAASMAVPAFAADPNTVVTGKYSETPIDVVVTTTADAIINPYGLGIKVEDSLGTSYPIMGKVVTNPMTVKNRSEYTLDVNVTAVTTATSGVSIVSSAPTASETTKQVKLDLQFATPSGITGMDELIGDAIISTYAASDTWSGAAAVALDGTTSGVSTTSAVATLKPADIQAGTFMGYGSEGIVLVRITGDCTTNPTGGWADTDGFETTVTYKFTPNTSAASSSSSSSSTAP